MASANPFDLLVDDDNDDVSQLIQKLPPPVKKAPVAEAPAKAAKMPSKPLPPAQAVRESRSDGQRGGGRGGGGRGTGRGRGGRYGRDSADNGNSYNNNGFSGGYRQPEEGDLDKSSERRGGYGGPRGGAPRGGRRGGFSNGDAADGERPRRVYERHSGTGRGNEYSKRDGAGRGNWGTPSDDIAPVNEEPVIDAEKIVDVENQTEQEDAGEASKENPTTQPAEEKEPEAKEMTLEEYEKVLEEKRKALLALKSEERKVTLDKDFESMQLLSSKKNEEEFFVKLGSDKDKRKEAEKEEKAKKALSINEFLKPAEGEKYYGPGRGRGRGRGPRGGYSGNNVPAPIIEDQHQFPTLGAK
ncbi:Hyaluronan/mRNA-binding protein [Heracleum sosnowskyi]|uniref:Hyaluronan/mRNA-binding protein n=1 Tax=Heracleum sosnowskyi TaxID=360622 RepID=A0AAD8HTA6_9APIA|nr:Hyaluronan/mRNA-binding protein [Heracleum sosnowskyi]